MECESRRLKRLPALLQNSSVGNLKPALGYSAYIL